MKIESHDLDLREDEQHQENLTHIYDRHKAEFASKIEHVLNYAKDEGLTKEDIKEVLLNAFKDCEIEL